MKLTKSDKVANFINMVLELYPPCTKYVPKNLHAATPIKKFSSYIKLLIIFGNSSEMNDVSLQAIGNKKIQLTN